MVACHQWALFLWLNEKSPGFFCCYLVAWGSNSLWSLMSPENRSWQPLSSFSLKHLPLPLGTLLLPRVHCDIYVFAACKCGGVKLWSDLWVTASPKEDTTGRWFPLFSFKETVEKNNFPLCSWVWLQNLKLWPSQESPSSVFASFPFLQTPPTPLLSSKIDVVFET